MINLNSNEKLSKCKCSVPHNNKILISHDKKENMNVKNDDKDKKSSSSRSPSPPKRPVPPKQPPRKGGDVRIHVKKGGEGLNTVAYANNITSDTLNDTVKLTNVSTAMSNKVYNNTTRITSDVISNPNKAVYDTTNLPIRILNNIKKLFRGGANGMDENAFDLRDLLDLYNNGSVDLYLILPKKCIWSYDSFTETKLNCYAFVLLLMITYRLPTNCDIIECFAKKFGLYNIECSHWIDVRSNSKVLNEYTHPLNTIFQLHQIITCIDSNANVDATIANYAVDNISNTITSYNPKNRLFGSVTKLYNKYEKVISDDKIMNEFEHNINKLDKSRKKLMTEYVLLQKFITNEFNSPVIESLYKFIASMSRLAYNNLLSELLKYVA